MLRVGAVGLLLFEGLEPFEQLRDLCLEFGELFSSDRRSSGAVRRLGVVGEAPAPRCEDPPFTAEEAEGLLNRHRNEAGLFGQLPHGRQFFPGRDRTALDPFPQVIG